MSLDIGTLVYVGELGVLDHEVARAELERTARAHDVKIGPIRYSQEGSLSLATATVIGNEPMNGEYDI